MRTTATASAVQWTAVRCSSTDLIWGAPSSALLALLISAARRRSCTARSRFTTLSRGCHGMRTGEGEREGSGGGNRPAA